MRASAAPGTPVGLRAAAFAEAAGARCAVFDVIACVTNVPDRAGVGGFFDEAAVVLGGRSVYANRTPYAVSKWPIARFIWSVAIETGPDGACECNPAEHRRRSAKTAKGFSNKD